MQGIVKTAQQQNQQDECVEKHSSTSKDDKLRLILFKPLKHKLKDWSDAFIYSNQILRL